MIKIGRPAGIDGFVPRGEIATIKLQQARLLDPEAGSESQKFSFPKSIYGTQAIKSRLSNAQGGMCCYCEIMCGGGYPGDVEHFRPKKRVRQDRGAPYVYPGYFWLAYHWDNLRFACFSCNSSAKSDYFPVGDPAHRATDHAGLIHERASLIDPVIEDPRTHIRFQGINPVAVTERGELTIRILKLARGGLKQPRLAHIKLLDSQLRLARLRDTPANEQDRAFGARELAMAVLPGAQFSSMSRDYLIRQNWLPAETG